MGEHLLNVCEVLCSVPIAKRRKRVATKEWGRRKERREKEIRDLFYLPEPTERNLWNHSGKHSTEKVSRTVLVLRPTCISNKTFQVFLWNKLSLSIFFLTNKKLLVNSWCPVWRSKLWEHWKKQFYLCRWQSLL